MTAALVTEPSAHVAYRLNSAFHCSNGEAYHSPAGDTCGLHGHLHGLRNGQNRRLRDLSCPPDNANDPVFDPVANFTLVWHLDTSYAEID
jgi:hypothetical protein